MKTGAINFDLDFDSTGIETEIFNAMHDPDYLEHVLKGNEPCVLDEETGYHVPESLLFELDQVRNL